MAYVKENKMQVMIAGAGYETVNRIKYYLTQRGHAATIARNAVECQVAVGKFVPQVLILELDVFWGDYDGVKATLNRDSRLSQLPVFLFTERSKKMPIDPSVRMIARLSDHLHPSELDVLCQVLNSMERNCAEAPAPSARSKREMATIEMGLELRGR